MNAEDVRIKVEDPCQLEEGEERGILLPVYQLINYGSDGRAPRKIVKTTLDQAEAKSWNTLHRSLEENIGFITESGKLYVSRLKDATAIYGKELLRQQALAKLTPEEIAALDLT